MPKRKTAATAEETAGESPKKAPGKRAAKPKPEPVTIRDPAPRKPLPDFPGPKYYKVISWNVNGIRALTKAAPDVLKHFVEAEKPDLLCLQETKLQDSHTDGLDSAGLIPGYKAVWACSTVKKGYAGTVVYYPISCDAPAGGGGGGGGGAVAAEQPSPAKGKGKKDTSKQATLSQFFGKAAPPPAASASAVAAADGAASTAAAAAAAAEAPAEGAVTGCSGLKVLGVSFGIGDKDHDGEGRAITVEYEKFFVVNLYVPNAGQKLERLDYRVEQWDKALRAYVARLAQGKGVIVVGDLNVAHLDLDIYNIGAPHIKKQAGLTPRERESFSEWVGVGQDGTPLEAAGESAEGCGILVDAFRKLHPTARGQYTYWSVKTSARPVNRGLRLDYALITKSLLAEGEGGAAKKGDPCLYDCWNDGEGTTVAMSDHGPVVCVLSL